MKRGLLNLLARAAVAASAALAITLVVGAVLVKTRTMPEPIEPAPAAVSAVQIEEPVEAGAESDALVERPLFWRSRRPLAPPEPEAEPEEPQPRRSQYEDTLDNAKLLGVFVSGPQAGAILKIKGKRHRVLVHEEIDGWQLISLTPGSATFLGPLDSSDPGERQLELEHARVKAPPADDENDSGENDSDENDTDTDTENLEQDRDSNE